MKSQAVETDDRSRDMYVLRGWADHGSSSSGNGSRKASVEAHALHRVGRDAFEGMTLEIAPGPCWHVKTKMQVPEHEHVATNGWLKRGSCRGVCT